MALSAFEKAFKDARASGETEFEFGGKKYNTKYKEEGAAPAKLSTPAKDTSNYSNEGRRPVASKPAMQSISSPNAKSKYQPGSVPTPEQAAENRQEAINKVKSVGRSIGDYISNFETPAERSARERKEAKPFKSGGSVSSASKRADGIAQKGKTRGKMC